MADKINERLVAIETEIKNIKTFINPYLKGQIEELKLTMGKIDNRVWWVLGAILVMGVVTRFL